MVEKQAKAPTSLRSRNSGYVPWEKVEGSEEEFKIEDK